MVAERVTQCVRADDMVARLAGDEFTVVLSRIRGMGAAERVARTILQSLAEPFHLRDRTLHVTSSVGIAVFPSAGQDVETMIGRRRCRDVRGKGSGQERLRLLQ